MAKTSFYAQRDLLIGTTELRPGDLIADVEPAAGIPIEKAVSAIVNGHATPTKIEPPAKAEKPKAPAK